MPVPPWKKKPVQINQARRTLLKSALAEAQAVVICQNTAIREHCKREMRVLGATDEQINAVTWELAKTRPEASEHAKNAQGKVFLDPDAEAWWEKQERRRSS